MLYDDYIEHEPGALETLRRYLNTQGGSSVSQSRQPNLSAGIIAGRSEAESSLHHHFGDPPLDSLRATVNQSQRTESVGIRNDLELAISSSPLHLFVCVERGRHKVDLQQQLITDISHDRELFLALRQRHREYRGLLRPYWSLRTVHGIHFMKVSSIANQSTREKLSIKLMSDCSSFMGVLGISMHGATMICAIAAKAATASLLKISSPRPASSINVAPCLQSNHLLSVHDS